ncbi:MAG: DUF465 domain-containing protein [Alphaproteobacteria bacterium]
MVSFIPIFIRIIEKFTLDMQEDQEELQLKLTEYRGEHQALDALIESALNGDGPVNLLHMQQLKKKKLWLKDVIRKLESALIDDIIA